MKISKKQGIIVFVLTLIFAYKKKKKLTGKETLYDIL